MFKSLFCVDSGIGGQSQGVLREESQNRYISNFKSLFAIYLYLLNYMIPGDKGVDIFVCSRSADRC